MPHKYPLVSLNSGDSGSQPEDPPAFMNLEANILLVDYIFTTGYLWATDVVPVVGAHAPALDTAHPAPPVPPRGPRRGCSHSLPIRLVVKRCRAGSPLERVNLSSEPYQVWCS